MASQHWGTDDLPANCIYIQPVITQWATHVTVEKWWLYPAVWWTFPQLSQDIQWKFSEKFRNNQEADRHKNTNTPDSKQKGVCKFPCFYRHCAFKRPRLRRYCLPVTCTHGSVVSTLREMQRKDGRLRFVRNVLHPCIYFTTLGFCCSVSDRRFRLHLCRPSIHKIFHKCVPSSRIYTSSTMATSRDFYHGQPPLSSPPGRVHCIPGHLEDFKLGYPLAP